MKENRGGTEVLTLSEAARYIRVSEKTLGEMARQNRIPCQKAGREWRFLKKALEDWLHSSPDNGKNEHNIEQRSRKISARDYKQGELFEDTGFKDTAFYKNVSSPLHRWVPWIAGFSSSFVEGVLESVVGNGKKITLLDPFAGVGTTLVEGMKNGHNVVGFEINPYAYLACRVKLNAADLRVKDLNQEIVSFKRFMDKKSSGNASPRSEIPAKFKTRSRFFSPSVERKVLFVLDYIASMDALHLKDLFRVALGAVMVGFSNYSYEPSLGRRVSAGKEEIRDADVAGIMINKLEQMKEDILYLQEHFSSRKANPEVSLYKENFLKSADKLDKRSIDCLITSPPYLNNYHYIRNTRPQLYWLGLAESSDDLKSLEHDSFGKFWQTVRSSPEIELKVKSAPLESALEKIREQNQDRGVYGGPGWANYAATYFNDCADFFQSISRLMKKKGTAVIVVGNNILQGIEIKSDEIMADISKSYGFETARFHRVRTKRTGTSIINSSVRAGVSKKKTELYETALELVFKG
ncbi:MAG: helix-turn-helix domain-containing protein [bacterium]